MKKVGFGLLLAFCVLGLVACEEEKNNDLTFDNASRLTVTVIPLSTEWGGFDLAPGERKKLKDIQNPDYRFEPDSQVQEGSSSTERYIIFVDAPPEK